MGVSEISTTLREAGITLTLDGADIIARPSTAVTSEIVDILRANKAALVESLQPVSSVEEAFELFGRLTDGGPRRPAPPSPASVAARRGLVAKWSREFGYISLHDPTTGEVHDLPTKEAPPWARWEAGTRKRLWRAGDKHAFDYSSAKMHEIWLEEHPVEEGIVEEHPIEVE